MWTPGLPRPTGRALPRAARSAAAPWDSGSLEFQEADVWARAGFHPGLGLLPVQGVCLAGAS